MTTPTPARLRRALPATVLAFLVTMMGTTIPTPLYSLYSAELHFSALTVTVLFAVYAVGVVGALLVFGRLSDDIGRRPVMALAVALAGVSALLFLLTPSLPLLITARIMSGLGAGLMSGTGTAAIMDLFPAERRTLAGAVAVISNTGGLALGTLIAGILADATPMPLRAPFLLHLTLCVIAMVWLWIGTPRPSRVRSARLRLHGLRVPPYLRAAFVRAVLAAGSGFAVTGVLTAVSALFLARELHLDSHALAGFVVFLAFAGMAAGQVIAGRLTPRVALPLGCLGLVLAAAGLAWALAGATLAPLLAAATTLGVAGGLCLNAALATTVGQVSPTHRGEVSSSFFAGLYTMLAVPAIGVGMLAAGIGLRPAGLVFAAVAAVLAATIGVIELLMPRGGGAITS